MRWVNYMEWGHLFIHKPSSARTRISFTESNSMNCRLKSPQLPACCEEWSQLFWWLYPPIHRSRRGSQTAFSVMAGGIWGSGGCSNYNHLFTAVTTGPSSALTAGPLQVRGSLLTWVTPGCGLFPEAGSPVSRPCLSGHVMRWFPSRLLPPPRTGSHRSQRPLNITSFAPPCFSPRRTFHPMSASDSPHLTSSPGLETKSKTETFCWQLLSGRL